MVVTVRRGEGVTGEDGWLLVDNWLLMVVGEECVMDVCR